MNIKGLKDLWKQAFGDTDEFLEDFFCVAFSEERCATTEEDGKIAALGKHAELLQTSGIYREVYESQTKGAEE